MLMIFNVEVNLPLGLTVLRTVNGEDSLRTRTAETVTVVSVGKNRHGRRLVGDTHLTQTSLVALLDIISGGCSLTHESQEKHKDYFM